jgi:N-acyl-D-amino-acid deacylase
MIYDILITNGRVLDGTGNPWFSADIGIQDSRIVALGALDKRKAKRVLDADGCYVTPGFIDIHSHSDLTLLILPTADSRIRQGITTEVNGNCGASLAPVSAQNRELLQKTHGGLAELVSWQWQSLGDYLKVLETQGVALNVGQLVGHGTIRMAVMGLEARKTNVQELEVMKSLVAQSMEDGALGLSSGLVYPPGCYSDTEELVALCKVVARYGGIYTSHIRGERETIVEALKEAIEIGERAGLPVQVSHNCPKYGGWGKLKQTLPLYEAARARGVEVTLDNDAHTDYSSSLWEALPQWVYQQGQEQALAIINSTRNRHRIKNEIAQDKYPGFGPIGLLKHKRWERIVIYKAHNSTLIGKSIRQIASERKARCFDTYLDLIREENGEVEAIFDYMRLDDIRQLLKHPLMMVCSDAYALSREGVLAQDAPYYPCCFGEYSYILEKFVREEKLITLQEAIRKMTSFPAQKAGLRDRGIISPGMWADLAIFDLEKLKDKSTRVSRDIFENYPHDYPEGIIYVLVNGAVVLENGYQTSILPGKVLRR